MNKFINRQIIKNVTTYNPDIEAVGIEEPKGKYMLLYEDNKYPVSGYIDTIQKYRDVLLLRRSLDGYYYTFHNGNIELVQDLGVTFDILMNGSIISTSSYDMTTFECYFNLYNLETSQLVLSENIPYNLYIEGDVIIAYNNFKGELKRILTDTSSVWEFPLEQLGEHPYYPGRMDTIEKVLGVVHGNLWFYTRGYRLVALDIKTGEKIFSYDCFGAYLDEKTKNMILLSGNFFEIVDTKALKIQERYNFLEIDSKGIGSYRAIYVPLLQGDYFTFIGEKGNEKNGCGWAGVFDYKARKLVWECEIITQEERRKTGNQLITPQRLFLSNNKLYIEDFLRNLHIFEVDL